MIDPGNGDVSQYYRVAAQLDRWGHFTFTRTNAYSGDNGRAAITNDEHGQDLLYAAGNAGQSKSPPGSGSNGVNTVYFVDTTGKACPSTSATPGVGLPVPGAQLPTSPPNLAVQNLGSTSKPNNALLPTNMCILKGFPTTLAASTTSPINYPFGMWFANDRTLYVADEGSGDNTYDSATNTYVNSTAAAQPEAGLEKWVLSGGSWRLAYTLQNGLDLGQPYTIPGYPTGLNTGPGGGGGPWSPATDGLRALTGRVGRDGVATVWAVTSTVAGSGDTGADPDKLVTTSDPVAAVTPPSWERFWTVRTAKFGQVLRGVSFTPGTDSESDR